ncbi:hypothetical protein [Bacillus seohaeanensis]|uniref:Uncharacterized protein n=1 Tax=Bacillus seohaeanensis TaxID=284580 RepID=A0ABW5RP09_9BACI
MKLIHSHPYYKVVREIKNNEQNSTEVKETIDLYDSLIATASKQFPLKNVSDISYKPLSDSYGFLYLHTNQGVFTFMVKESPKAFIDEYLKLK